jgi:hypothetical protein
LQGTLSPDDSWLVGVMGGVRDASLLYSDMCRRGWGVGKDAAAALRWMGHAAERGNEIAQGRLQEAWDGLRPVGSGGPPGWALPGGAASGAEATAAPALCAQLLVARSIAWSKVGAAAGAAAASPAVSEAVPRNGLRNGSKEAAAAEGTIGCDALLRAAVADSRAATAVQPRWARAQLRYGLALAALCSSQLSAATTTTTTTTVSKPEPEPEPVEEVGAAAEAITGLEQALTAVRCAEELLVAGEGSAAAEPPEDCWETGKGGMAKGGTTLNDRITMIGTCNHCSQRFASRQAPFSAGKHWLPLH